MKLTKEQLDNLIKECVDEHMSALSETDIATQQSGGNPSADKDQVHSDLFDAMSALGNASRGLRALGMKPTEIEDAYFKVKRFLQAMK